MGGLLPQDIELTKEVTVVKLGVLGANLPSAVVGLKDDYRLHDTRLIAPRRRTENGVVGRHQTPTKSTETQAAGNGLELLLLLLVGSLGEEDVSNSVFALFGKLGAERVGALADKELVGDASHYTGSITITGVGAG